VLAGIQELLLQPLKDNGHAWCIRTATVCCCCCLLGCVQQLAPQGVEGGSSRWASGLHITWHQG
jgi:hypothetical protein